MKRIDIHIGFAFALVLFLTSCQQDVKIWDSETLDYSGRYVIKLMNEDMSKLYYDYDGSELRIYNTSENIANMVWMDDVSQLIPLKSKISLNGTSELFKSADLDFNNLDNNINAIGADDEDPPTAEGQTIEVDRDYLRAAVLEGKIIPQSVRTKGGNLTDSIYIKVALYSGKAVFNSYLKPEKDWKDPTQPEYGWNLSSLIYDASKDETIVIGGYRYTGFAEDEY